MTAPVQRELQLEELARIAGIVSSLTPVSLEAWLRTGRRMRDGMPFAEAEALMWAELAAAEGNIVPIPPS